MYCNKSILSITIITENIFKLEKLYILKTGLTFEIMAAPFLYRVKGFSKEHLGNFLTKP